jgi:hypothetical protein
MLQQPECLVPPSSRLHSCICTPPSQVTADQIRAGVAAVIKAHEAQLKEERWEPVNPLTK